MMDRNTKRRPNFIYIGPDKAGSTWIDNILRHHPQVAMASTKETFFFDRYFEKGMKWYLTHFNMAADCRVVGEVSHDYLFNMQCCERIACHLPNVRLMVCLREPVQRALSAYLYMLRQGRIRGTFEQAIANCPELIDHGRYAAHLRPYVEQFGRNRIHITLFDDLQQVPQRFAEALFRFLEIDSLHLSNDLLKKALPAASPRNFLMAIFAKRAAVLIRQLGYPALVHRIKTSRILQSILYRPLRDEEKPTLGVNTLRELKCVFQADVKELDHRYGLGLARRWGYEDGLVSCSHPIKETIALCQK